MEGEKVVLDRRSFEALAVDTRVRILKSLKQRRKTLSEIAQEMKMSVSGVKEHLETLEGADLVKKMDDGHKWKYYELTKKGSDLVAPKELRVWVVLSIAMIALIVSMLSIMPTPSIVTQNGPVAGVEAPVAANPQPSIQVQNAQVTPTVMTAAYSSNSSQNEAGIRMNGTSAENSGIELPQDNGVPMLVGGISVLTILACLGILAMNRLR